MSRTRLLLAALCVVVPLILAVPSNATHLRKKPLPTPTFVGGAAVLRSNTIVFDGTFRFKGKPVPVNVTWAHLAIQDASGAGLSVSTTSGMGRSFGVPFAGAYGLTATFTVTAAASATHRAASRTTPVAVILGGFAAVGSVVPTLQQWGDESYTYPYMTWTGGMQATGAGPTVHLPTAWLKPSVMGDCRWQSLPPSPPTDVVPAVNWGNGVSDGVVTTTPFTIYGGRFVCDDGYTVEPELFVEVGYPGDTCQLLISGVTSFTIPPDWAGNVSFTAVLLTFAPDGSLYAASGWTYSPWITLTSGALDVCQAYHLPPQNTSGVWVPPRPHGTQRLSDQAAVRPPNA